ncbi:hypothetical protein AAFF_G00189250 [Aldrovandia affinis]|uniref:Cytochrome c oxidase subunit 7B, mitochondrial n=1 Tax=Aldrovandia affinis TaxID=143900 RepID=A0AAD7RJJ1_9TELE|nr:hypothetical protein AAFF_G00189250 [Aldrovandia affinis]
MFRFAKAALNLTAQGARRVAVRHESHNVAPTFHTKYGNMMILSGTVFCIAVWSYVVTQTGITWNLSPVGKVTPKEWKGIGGSEEEEE